jgi:putative PIN family toxin of toxin-antitoxin system
VGEIARVILDTNVIISAYGWGGTPYRIIDLLLTDQIKNFSSLALIRELKATLAYTKLSFPIERQTHVVEVMLAKSILVDPSLTLNVIQNDPKDNRVLECALEAKADCIISGDKDHLYLRSWEGISILKITDFLGSSWVT